MIEAVANICKGRGPLLLALSGGPDSTALYHLLRQVKHPFEVIHVDHGWRASSQKEAMELEKSVNVPFHLRKLEPVSKNQEDQARKGRLSLYRDVMDERGLEAVLLAHHADDQAETILKRLFEGARLTRLTGLVREREIEGVTILRPLLQFRKKQIINWLDENAIGYFVEPPGLDLRSRMRNDILPLLTRYFGKEVTPALLKIGARSDELQHSAENFWLKEGISDFLESERVTLSQPTVQSVLNHLKSNGRKKVLRVRRGQLTIEHGVLRYNKRIDAE